MARFRRQGCCPFSHRRGWRARYDGSYDDLNAGEVIDVLCSLEVEDLDELRRSEVSDRSRRTALAASDRHLLRKRPA